jgi:RNA polymerase sigma-B factor
MIAEPSPQQLVATLGTYRPDDPRRPALRERVITAWLPLAFHLARRYRGRGEDTEDLQQVAVAGLIESVDRYRAERGTAFAAYAVPTVLGEIKRHFRDRCWSIRVPRRHQEVWLSILSVRDALTQDLGRAPRVPEIAARLQITEEQVTGAVEAAQAYHTVSFVEPHAVRRGARTGDTVSACDPGYEWTEIRLTLRDAVARLDERERLLLRLRFHGNLTQKQIGEHLGVSQVHVSRLLSATVRRLRHLVLEAD